MVRILKLFINATKNKSVYIRLIWNGEAELELLLGQPITVAPRAVIFPTERDGEGSPCNCCFWRLLLSTWQRPRQRPSSICAVLGGRARSVSQRTAEAWSEPLQCTQLNRNTFQKPRIASSCTINYKASFSEGNKPWTPVSFRHHNLIGFPSLEHSSLYERFSPTSFTKQSICCFPEKLERVTIEIRIQRRISLSLSVTY